MEIVILGSSAAIPVKDRNLSSIALKFGSEIIIFDCGEDIQRAFNAASLKFNKPLTILITHFHGDHIIGLPGLLFRFGLGERTEPVSLYGPRNLFLYLYTHRKILGLNPKYPVNVYELDIDNNSILKFEGLESDQAPSITKIENNILFENNKYILKFTEVDHSVLTFAYSFIEKPRYGKFNPDKAKELGIPMSGLWKKLQAGDSIEFEGKTIDPEKTGIVGPKRKGRKITYSGDTAPCDSLIELGMNSDLIIHEATFAKALADIAMEKKHSTSIDAANDAVKMNAKQLLLTHISSRYQEDAENLLEEAKEIFPNTIIAKDLLRITLK